MRKRILAAALVGMAVVASVSGCRKIKDSTTEEETFAVQDYSSNVELGDYTNLDIEVSKADVTDEQLKTAIADVIKAGTTKAHVTDRVVADKDKINLDYTGYLDGEAFDNGSTEGKGTDYTIGGNYIEDLNDQLIGLECGKDYDLTCTFPESYTANADLAGKEVVFKVKVNYIYGDDIVPEWTDDFIKTYTDSKYTTTADYEKYLTDTLKEQNDTTQASEYTSSLWSTIIEASTINEYPQEDIDALSDSYYTLYSNYYSSMASYYSYTYDQLLEEINTSDDKLKEQCADQAKSDYEYFIVAGAIAAKEGIELTEEEYESKAQGYADDYSYDSVEAFEAENNGKAYLINSFIVEKVTEYLEENNNKIETDKVTDDEEETTTAAE